MNEPAPSRGERLALASARVPFRVKTALVWVGIFLALGLLFVLARFDNAWMLDNVGYIAGGLQFTLFIALGGIVLAESPGSMSRSFAVPR